MNSCMRTVLVGFIAGALGVLIFHQLGFWIANELGYARAPLYNLRPVPPWGVPTILSMAFWGGLWGVGAAFLVPRLPGMWGFGMWLIARLLRAAMGWR
jgi:hypothetical protein